MKSILIGFLLLLTASLAAAETYKVIFVQGTIVRQKTGAPLKVGDEIDKSEPLEYKSDDASVHAFNPEFGRITLGKAGATLAASGGGRDATRAAGMPSGNFVIFDITTQDFDAQKYRPAQGKFVFQFEYEGQKIERPLTPRENQLVLKRDALYGDNIDPKKVKNPKLVYDDGNTPVKTHFNPIFVDVQKVQKEVQFIVETSKRKSKDNRYIIGETLEFLKSAYGEINTTNVLEWLDHAYDVRHRIDFERALGAGSKLAILGEELVIDIEPTYLPNMPDGPGTEDLQDIEFTFNYKGQKLKKVLNEPNRKKIVLNRQTFFTDENGKPLEPSEVKDGKLIYYNKKEEPVLICRFNPTFVDDAVAKKHAESVIKSLQDSGKPAESIKEAVAQEMISNFGALNPQNFESWLKQNFNF